MFPRLDIGMGQDQSHETLRLDDPSHLVKRTLQPGLELVVRNVFGRLLVRAVFDDLCLFGRKRGMKNVWVQVTDTALEPH